MRKLPLILSLIIITIAANAQVITLSPEKPTFTEEVTLTYNAAEGNAALKDCNCDIYAHTGLLTAESTSPGDWKHVVAEWNENLDKLRLKKVDDNVYELRFSISDLYGIPATGGNLTALNFVFRNKKGDKVGKDKGDKDIYYYFKKPNFKTAPKAFDVSQAKTPEWAKYASIYEVNIRQYTEEGTINAFAEHLPRLRELGVDILWFMPIQPIGEKDRKGTLGSYYSIQDYRAVNPEFGTIEDFKRLVNKAHGMGFKVILDWVANHTSRDNIWIESNPTWYNYEENGEIVAPYDWSDVADLNYEMYYMRQAMSEAMLFWVKECDIDGFRCDVAGEVPADFWNDNREKLNAVKDVWMLAEDGSKMHLLNTAFNANYGWEFHHLMNEVAKGNETANVLIENIKKLETNYPKGSFAMHFITNHDENTWKGTVFDRLGEAHKAFAVLTFTVQGMPLMYSGQEAGNTKRLEFFEKDPIDWGNFELMPFYTKLNDLRGENPALWTGLTCGSFEILEHNNQDNVVAFVRELNGNKVLTIINLSDEKQKVKINLGEHNGSYQDYMTDKNVTLEANEKVKLDKWEFKVLVLD